MLLIFVLLILFLLLLHKRKRSRALHIEFFVNGKRVHKMFSLKDSQQVPFTVVAKDAKGNPTTAFDAVPTWGVSDGTILKVVPAADGLSAVVSPVGPLGTGQLQFNALSDGKALSGALDVQIVPGDAVSVDLVAGTPEDLSDDSDAPTPTP